MVGMAGPDAAPAFGDNLGRGDVKELVTAAFNLGACKASLAATQALFELNSGRGASETIHIVGMAGPGTLPTSKEIWEEVT